jgi:hypothetical protein
MVRLQESTFELNMGVDGGAARVTTDAQAGFDQCVFSDNVAGQGSAVSIQIGGTVNFMLGCSIFNNTQLLDYVRLEDAYVSVQPKQVYSAYAIDLFAKRCDHALLQPSRRLRSNGCSQLSAARHFSCAPPALAASWQKIVLQRRRHLTALLLAKLVCLELVHGAGQTSRVMWTIACTLSTETRKA